MSQDIPLHHHKLVAWQRADDLFIRIHLLSRTFPSYERYELGSQIRRAAYSVVANIVEGFGRRTLRDRVHFLHIAAASLAEVGYCIHAVNASDTSPHRPLPNWKRNSVRQLRL